MCVFHKYNFLPSQSHNLNPNLWPFLCFSLNKIAEAQSQVKSLQDKVTQLERENGELKSKASQVCEMRDSVYEFQVTMMNRII